MRARSTLWLIRFAPQTHIVLDAFVVRALAATDAEGRPLARLLTKDVLTMLVFLARNPENIPPMIAGGAFRYALQAVQRFHAPVDADLQSTAIKLLHELLKKRPSRGGVGTTAAAATGAAAINAAGGGGGGGGGGRSST